MSTTRRLSLAVEDPLEPGPKKTPEKAARPQRRGAPVQPRRSDIAPAPESPNTKPQAQKDLWRAWSNISRPASYRLPDDLLTELDERARALRLPIGLTVTAALLQLLDAEDDKILELVERAEDAQHHARRNARRRRARPDAM